MTTTSQTDYVERHIDNGSVQVIARLGGAPRFGQNVSYVSRNIVVKVPKD